MTVGDADPGHVAPSEIAPREVALRILEGLFVSRDSSGIDPDGRPEACTLAEFQAEGVSRIRSILDRRGGAILADSVGLGKTYMALALIEEALRASGDAVVVVPAATRGLWRRALRRLPEAGGGWRLVSHTRLARGARVRPAPDGGAGRRLVVVDEAHRFRNPASLRYAALARLVSPGARLLLLTATPVNNRPEDLLHLVRLFAADDAFRDVGVPSLRDAFAPGPGPEREPSHGTNEAGSARVNAVVRATVVRRTRAMVRDRFGESAAAPSPPGRPALRFPRRASPRLVRYLDPALPRLVAELRDLELAPYSLRGPDSSGAAGSAALVRIGLLKRLDSSPAAFRASLHRLAQILRATLDAARAGRVLAPGRCAPGRRAPDADPLQLTLIELIARPAPPDLDTEALARSVERDLARVRKLGRLRGMPDPVAADPVALDSKLLALHDLLARTRRERVLVFTEYRDTAESLWRGLRDRYRVGRVDGSGAWLGRRRAGRRAVVERFAPRANSRRPPPERERVDVLIATDVLAEGLNLQDARHVVSYELPWNPVRLLQRIGRVDRLGSPHYEVAPYLFAPQAGLETMLGLTRRVRTKLGHIATTVGTEQADELLDRLAEATHARRPPPGLLETALEKAESGTADPMEELRTLWIRNRAARRPAIGERPVPTTAGISLPADCEEARLAWVVLAARSGGPWLIEIDRSGAVTDAGDAARTVLGLALRGGPGVAPSAAVPLAAIEEHLRRTTGAASAPPRLSRHDPGLRLMRRVRRSMARAGAGLDPRVVARADALLERVSTPLDPTGEANVRRFLERSEDGPITALIDAAESVLRGAGRIGHQAPQDGRDIAILAALQIRISDTPLRG